MARTRPTSTTKLAPRWGTSSGINPGEDFEEPQDLTDVVGIDSQISRGSRGGGGLDFPSTGGLEDGVPRGSRSPTSGALGGKPALSPGKPPLAPGGGIDLGKDPLGGGLLEGKPPGGGLQGKARPRSPIGLEAGKSAGGGLNITVSLPLGGGPISGRGGLNIGKDGAIKGAQVGLGFGLGPIGGSIDVGTDQDEEGRGGCYQYVTIAAGPFSHTYGRNVCEPKSPNLPPKLEPVFINRNPNNFPLSWKCPNGTSYYLEVHGLPFHEGMEKLAANWEFNTLNGGYVGAPKHVPFTDAQADVLWGEGKWIMDNHQYLTATRYHGHNCWRSNTGQLAVEYPILMQFSYDYELYTTPGFYQNNKIGQFGKFSNFIVFVLDISPYPNCVGGFADPNVPIIPLSPPLFSPLSPPIPNPPPRKKMNDCCEKVLPLLGEVLRLLGRPVGPNGLAPMTGAPGLLGEKIKRIQTPITDGKKPKEIEISFPTIYQMLVYVLKQANDLDTALDPKSYKIPSGYIPNPEYNRDSEYSLKNNDQPDKDKNGRDRELEINESDKAKIGGFLQQQEYIFAAIKRLEYLFPYGELADAMIAKNLLIPGAEGDIKIHNIIMFLELQTQYLNATLGNPREVLTVKDANPALAGDQPVEVKALTLSDWMRQVVKFQIDTGGDVDASVNLALRIFRTGMANRKDIIRTAEMTQALFEDSGMREQQDYIPVYLEGDPYAGQWVKGEGFKPNPDLEKKTEEATEKVLRETMKPTEIKLKVSRRHTDEKTDMRDLFRGLADFFQRLLSIPTGGDAAKSIEKLIESAKFKVQTDMALIRQNVTKAAAASRNRTKKRKK